MSAIMEEMCDEAKYFTAIEIAEHMIARGKAGLEEIAEDTGLALNEVQRLVAQNCSVGTDV